MSSEFLDDIENDYRDTTVLLSMKASGDAFLCVSGEDNSHDYHLPPNEKGWNNAKKIIEALDEWIKHTKRINCNSYTGKVLEKENYYIFKLDDEEYKIKTL